MLKYLFFFPLVTALIGIWRVEDGSYSPSFGQYGAPNGAMFWFSVFSLIAVGTYAAVSLRPSADRRGGGVITADDHFKSAAASVIAVNLAFLIILLFGAGAWRVWAGSVGKGEFRSTLGGMGAFLYLGSKMILPCFLAYLAAIYKGATKTRSNKYLMLFAVFSAVIFGASWGFKASGVIILIPAMIVYFWRVSMSTLAKMAAGLTAFVVASFYWFDASDAAAPALELLWTRLTVMQGEIAWGVWGLFQEGESFPAYGKMLFSALGDRLVSLLFGLERGDTSAWIDYKYDMLLTYLTGVPLSQIEEGHNVTGTPFAEGVIAGGAAGIVLFAILTGGLSAIFRNQISDSLARGDPIMAAIGATYFGQVIFPWLNAGTLALLFHVSTIVGLVLCYLGLRFIHRVRFVV